MKRCLFFILLFIFGFTVIIYGQEAQLTVDQCVEIALEQNPDIIRGEFTVKIAGKDVTVAMSNFLPYISTSMQYNHSVVGPSSALRIDPQTGILVPIQPSEIASWSSSIGISVNQTIFNGGYDIFNFNRSRAMKSSAEYTFENTKQTVIYVVKERYYNLLAAEKLLGVAEETILSSEESYKRAQVLFEVGKASKSDVLKAEVQLGTGQLNLIQSQNSLSIARASLNHILGLDVDYQIQVVDDLDIPEMEVSYEDAAANTFMYHPSLIGREYDVKASKAGVSMSISQYLPSISAFYGYNWRQKDFSMVKNMLDSDYSWYVGVSLSLPIFQGFSRVANLSRARFNYQSSLEALEQTKSFGGQTSLF
jgi:outer membrane protein TolC